MTTTSPSQRILEKTISSKFNTNNRKKILTKTSPLTLAALEFSGEPALRQIVDCLLDAVETGAPGTAFFYEGRIQTLNCRIEGFVWGGSTYLVGTTSRDCDSQFTGWSSSRPKCAKELLTISSDSFTSFLTETYFRALCYTI